ncbi:MAG: UDP-N-acetylglucosamine diphosphorylase [Aminipila sp.]
MTFEDCIKLESERMEINKKHLENGVEFIDIKTAYIGKDVIIGKGTVIYPCVTLEGRVIIGVDCVIGQNSRIIDSNIGDRTDIQCSVITESNVGDDTKIGPFAYLRPKSNIGNHCKVGDFVEVKNSTMGDGAKASHLTYIGDSDVGQDVNLGCGVVFVNYDGKNKHRSIIEDGAFIGCNTNLVSPVRVEKGAYVAAGSTVTKNVPKGSLYVSRAKERIIEGWVERRGLLSKKEK